MKPLQIRENINLIYKGQARTTYIRIPKWIAEYLNLDSTRVVSILCTKGKYGPFMAVWNPAQQMNPIIKLDTLPDHVLKETLNHYLYEARRITNELLVRSGRDK